MGLCERSEALEKKERKDPDSYGIDLPGSIIRVATWRILVNICKIMTNLRTTC